MRGRKKEKLLAHVPVPVPGKKPKVRSEIISTTVTSHEQKTIPLASACDIGIFSLFDLPPEMVRDIISEMINSVGFYSATRLRFVNSKFLSD